METMHIDDYQYYNTVIDISLDYNVCAHVIHWTNKVTQCKICEEIKEALSTGCNISPQSLV